MGRAFWVQTPAREFPLEPHFRLPWFQFWPMALRVFAVRLGTRLGRYPAWAERECRAIRLLSANEMAQMFPHTTLWRERFGPLTKSCVAHTL